MSIALADPEFTRGEGIDTRGKFFLIAEWEFKNF